MDAKTIREGYWEHKIQSLEVLVKQSSLEITY